MDKLAKYGYSDQTQPSVHVQKLSIIDIIFYQSSQFYPPKFPVLSTHVPSFVHPSSQFFPPEVTVVFHLIFKFFSRIWIIFPYLVIVVNPKP